MRHHSDRVFEWGVESQRSLKVGLEGCVCVYIKRKRGDFGGSFSTHSGLNRED